MLMHGSHLWLTSYFYAALDTFQSVNEKDADLNWAVKKLIEWT